MGDVIVLGGYGRVGLACVRELAETSRLGVVLAGRSVQKAEQAALACGENVRGAYANASDPRTLRALLPGSLAVVCCTGGGISEALAISLESRIPFVAVSPAALHPSLLPEAGRSAWEAQVPVILGAGAVPGIPGVLADYLVRRLPEIDQLRIVTTGAWRGTETALRDVNNLRRDRSQPLLSHGEVGGAPSPRRWRFPEPIGWWPVRRATTIDLVGFAQSHCVDNLAYLEIEPGPLARVALRLFRHARAPSEFSAIAEAYRSDGSEQGAERVEILAPDILRTCAGAVGVVVRAILEERVPAGLLTQREAMNPAVFLNELHKREIRVSFSPG